MENNIILKLFKFFKKSLQFITSIFFKMRKSFQDYIARQSEFSLRLIFGSVVVFVYFSMIFLGNTIFVIFCIFLSNMSILEMIDIIPVNYDDKEKEKWRKILVSYVMITFISLVIVRFSKSGMLLMTWLIYIIIITDTSAYMIGNFIGKRKLCPSISPGKTWEGSIGGLLSGIISANIFYPFFSSFVHINIYNFQILNLITIILAQGGDLLESKIKRIMGVKDSGSIIPGHGGIMDRVDSLTLAAPFIALLLFFGIL